MLRLAVAVAWVAWLVGLVTLVALADPSGVLFYATYAGIGGFLAMRRPNVAVGWLLILEGIGLGLGNIDSRVDPAVLVAGSATPAQAFAAWAESSGWSISFLAATGVALVFPDAPFPTLRGRPLASILLIVSAAVSLLILFGPVINIDTGDGLTTADVPNPFVLPPMSWLPPSIVKPDTVYPVLFIGFVLSVGSLIGRFRRSSGLARVQFRWLAAAMLVVAVATVFWVSTAVYLRIDAARLGDVAVAVAYPLVPIAIAMAVLRYRLYDIDRVISRTLGWGVATAAVLAVLVAGVLVLQAALTDVTQGQTLATAASTLLALALFQPVHRRVQRVVDRRFDRPRVEAERTVEAHGERLAHETDLPTIEAGVIDTVATTLRPASARLWIRSRERSSTVA